MKRKPLLGYVVSHPIQYQAPLFRQLARSDAVDFIALFGCDFGNTPSFDPAFEQTVDFGVSLLDGYASQFLPQGAREPRIDRFWGLRFRCARNFPTRLPDAVVVHGWRTAMMWQAAARCVLGRIPYLLRAETPAWSVPNVTQGPHSLRKRIRDIAVRSLIARASRLLALGAANERFYLRMGSDSAKIARVPYVVDNAAVAAAAHQGGRRRKATRERLGIGVHDVVLVGAGKLMPRKRPLDVVRAMAALPGKVHLVWIGSGSVEAEMRGEAERLHLSDRVHLAGFLPSPEAWSMLGMADLFVCPSEAEPWGLVINEAVAAGLPVLASDQCGAAENLLVPDRTGEIVATGNVSAWEDALRRWTSRILAGDRGDRDLMSRLAADHSLEAAAAAIEAAALSVLAPAECSLIPAGAGG
jgi:glycosyltransferase involved in cell wall biosynthesis